MDPILIHINDTTKFLLPLVIKEGYTYKDIQQNLLGAYISALELPEYDQHIFIVLNDDINISCLKENYIDRLIVFDKEFDTYDYIFIYEIEDSLTEDYIHFINGEYSQLSIEIKNIILAFWNTNTDSFLYSILHRDTSNFTKFLEQSKIKDNPWNNLYTSWIQNFKSKKELHKAPNLKQEMYGYNSEL